MKTSEEIVVNLLADNVRGNIDLMLNIRDFIIAYNAGLAVLRTLGVSESVLVSDERAFNEYEHLLVREPKSEYLNAFNHISKL